MGWDAEATLHGEFLKRTPDGRCIERPPLRAAFEAAESELWQHHGIGITYLRVGQLNGRCYRDMLERATGLAWEEPHEANPRGERYRSPEEVRTAQEGADWGFTYDRDEAAAYWGARIFLETCSANGLGIYCSW